MATCPRATCTKAFFQNGRINCMALEMMATPEAIIRSVDQADFPSFQDLTVLSINRNSSMSAPRAFRSPSIRQSAIWKEPVVSLAGTPAAAARAVVTTQSEDKFVAAKMRCSSSLEKVYLAPPSGRGQLSTDFGCSANTTWCTLWRTSWLASVSRESKRKKIYRQR